MSDANLILLADIGATNLRFALCESAAVPLRAGSIRRYRAADHSSLSEAAARYLQDVGARPSHAVFAIAGRVDGCEVKITNLPWTVSAAEVAQTLGLDSVRLVNDFAAQSRSLPLLQAADLEVLGTPPAPLLDGRIDRCVAVVGPGTGLGAGALLLRGGQAIVLETEGGHLGFAPGTDEEDAILHYLRREFGRVSNERLLCGSGLVNLYGALCQIRTSPRLATTPERVMQSALDGSDATAVRAVDLFAELLGDVAGDLVLACGAWDGVFLGGGLLEPLLPVLRRGGFRARFEAKGRLAATMARTPTVAMRHPNTGLLGAAGIALDARAAR
ncbi:glucokinase [Tahibacter caeni]|uniref:glucokinase n=1 Tax=Tahibacter caeni TaxID=1453545 RepID=UPI002147B0A5|nr:glucokinase [Tahibacter caeni]